MSLFLEKFHIYTENRFSFLKLTGADIYVRKQSVTVNFIYPEGREKEVLLCADEIRSAAARALGTAVEVDVKLTLSHFDRQFFRNDFMDFLKRFPFLLSDTTGDDIIVFEADGRRGVTLNLSGYIMDSCNEKNVAAQIKEYFSTYYCDEIELIMNVRAGSDEIEMPVFDDDEPSMSLDDSTTGRHIIPQNVDELIGPPIYERAAYIEDCVAPRERLVVCGTLTRFSEHTSKPKEGATEGKKYYRMTIEDFTGKLDFLFFPTKFNADKITLLKAGKQIVTRGALERDNRNASALVYKVRDISYCTLPQEFKINRLRRAVEKDYLYIKPQEYRLLYQASIFELELQKKVPSYLKGKTFVVFDLETTGLSAAMGDRVIEIGAVKIVDGVMTEVFSTFVDPQVPVPQRITEFTGITDLDVMGKPLFSDVIVDFYKFTEGAVLVAQNYGFDHSFVAAAGKPLNIYFDGDYVDTIPFVRKQFPKIKNYKLGTIAQYLGVSLENAHRAIDDAVATAEIFIKTAEKMG